MVVGHFFPGMEKLRKQMMEEAVAQLKVNSEKIASNEGKGPSWEDKVYRLFIVSHFNSNVNLK